MILKRFSVSLSPFSPFLCLSVIISLFLCLSVTVSLFCVSPSLFFRFSVSLLSVSTFLCLSVTVFPFCVSPSPFFRFSVSFSPSLCLRFFPRRKKHKRRYLKAARCPQRRFPTDSASLHTYEYRRRQTSFHSVVSRITVDKSSPRCFLNTRYYIAYDR